MRKIVIELKKVIVHERMKQNIAREVMKKVLKEESWLTSKKKEGMWYEASRKGLLKDTEEDCEGVERQERLISLHGTGDSAKAAKDENGGTRSENVDDDDN